MRNGNHLTAFSENVDTALVTVALALLAVLGGVLVRGARLLGAVLLLGFRQTMVSWLRRKGVPDEKIREVLDDDEWA